MGGGGSGRGCEGLLASRRVKTSLIDLHWSGRVQDGLCGSGRAQEGLEGSGRALSGLGCFYRVQEGLFKHGQGGSRKSRRIWEGPGGSLTVPECMEGPRVSKRFQGGSSQ